MKVLEAVFSLPTASVNTSAATLIDFSPSPLGVKVAVYTDPLPDKEPIEPPDKVISPATKLVVTSLDVKVNAIDVALLEVALDTVDEVIVIVGGAVSYFHENVLEVVFSLPTASVNTPAPTLIVFVPSPLGVKVAVYTDPLPDKEPIEPPDKVISVAIKFVVISLDVNVNATDVALLEVSLDTVDEVIVIVGPVES